MSTLATNSTIVIQPGKKITLHSVPIEVLSALIIYSVFIPVVITDLWVSFYQFAYFGIHQIPKVDKRDYVVFDREHLNKLSWLQKVNCIYCEYVNGTAAWVKAVAAQTEIYSCAIKHWHPAKGQDHQENFYSYRSFK
jgi:hypothetical protein